MTAAQAPEDAMPWPAVAAKSARLGFRLIDLAEELQINTRRLRRIRKGQLPVPHWMADQITTWEEEVDTDAEAWANKLITLAPTLNGPVTLTRYPAKGYLQRTQTGIKARSVETWDAYLAIVISQLDHAGIDWELTTK